MIKTNKQSNNSQIDGFIKTNGKYEMECFKKSKYNQRNLDFCKFHSNNFNHFEIHR